MCFGYVETDRFDNVFVTGAQLLTTVPTAEHAYINSFISASQEAETQAWLETQQV